MTSSPAFRGARSRAWPRAALLVAATVMDCGPLSIASPSASVLPERTSAPSPTISGAAAGRGSLVIVGRIVTVDDPGDQSRRGHLAAGTLGDVTILTGDLTAATPDEIRAMDIVATIVGGVPVYCSNSAICSQLRP